MRRATSALAATTALSWAIVSAAQVPPPPGGGSTVVTPPTPVRLPEVPPPVPSPFASSEGAEATESAGFRDGFFLRDARDQFHLFPRALFQLDFNSSFGPGVDSVGAPDTQAGLKPQLKVGAVRVGLGGDVFRRLSFLGLVEFGGSTTARVTPSSTNPAAGRYLQDQVTQASASLADFWVNYRVCDCANFMAGQFDVPFSLENRTPLDTIPWMSRNIAVRSFAVPSSQDLGLMIWGELGPRMVAYEAGIFGGDGQNRPSVDSRADFMGRLYVRPFAQTGGSTILPTLQLGVSARHGDRDPSMVSYDVPAITTGQGFVLWQPTYTDSLGRLIHVIPSGSENVVGGELYGRTERIAVQAEAFYLNKQTREAVDGFQQTNTERFGRMRGASFYVQVSGWLFGDPFVAGEPGVERPRRLEPTRSAKVKEGLEVMGIAAGILANYSGATRLGSVPDVNTPSGDITIYQLGLGAQYWYSKHVRVGLNFMTYVTPGSGGSTNLAVVPDNLSTGADGSARSSHVFHELGLRLSLAL